PFFARGTTKSVRIINAFSKLALPSNPQYWQRKSSRSRIAKFSFKVVGLSTRVNVVMSSGMRTSESEILESVAGNARGGASVMDPRLSAPPTLGPQIVRVKCMHLSAAPFNLIAPVLPFRTDERSQVHANQAKPNTRTGRKILEPLR